ncbi:hypothetical protein HK097_000082, partial [Rhizophlyctis rosea]
GAPSSIRPAAHKHDPLPPPRNLRTLASFLLPTPAPPPTNVKPDVIYDRIARTCVRMGFPPPSVINAMSNVKLYNVDEKAKTYGVVLERVPEIIRRGVEEVVARLVDGDSLPKGEEAPLPIKPLTDPTRYLTFITRIASPPPSPSKPSPPPSQAPTTPTENLCPICFTNPSNASYNPCHHSACSPCAKKAIQRPGGMYRKCFLCRVKVEKVIVDKVQAR